MTSARLVFDLDGTLIDSAPDIRATANLLLAREGRAELSLEDTRAFIGHGAPVFVARMREARDLPDSLQDRLLGDFVALYDKAVGLTQPYPGVEEALQRLSDAGHRLGICTNKPLGPARAVLAHLGLDRYFGAVVGGDSHPSRKPDPAPLRAAFEALGQGPMLYVGDSEVDAETSARARVPFLLFTEGYRKVPAEVLPHAALFSHYEQLQGLVGAALSGGRVG